MAASCTEGFHAPSFHPCGSHVSSRRRHGHLVSRASRSALGGSSLCLAFPAKSGSSCSAKALSSHTIMVRVFRCPRFLSRADDLTCRLVSQDGQSSRSRVPQSLPSRPTRKPQLLLQYWSWSIVSHPLLLPRASLAPSAMRLTVLPSSQPLGHHLSSHRDPTFKRRLDMAEDRSLGAVLDGLRGRADGRGASQRRGGVLIRRSGITIQS